MTPLELEWKAFALRAVCPRTAVAADRCADFPLILVMIGIQLTSRARANVAGRGLLPSGSAIAFARTQTGCVGRFRSNNRKRNLVNRRLNIRAYLVNNLANRRSDPNVFLCIRASSGQKWVIVSQDETAEMASLGDFAYCVIPRDSAGETVGVFQQKNTGESPTRKRRFFFTAKSHQSESAVFSP